MSTWKTINAVPLVTPFCNRYRLNDGRTLVDPCPAVLIQEKGGEIRAVFATFAKGVLMPACDTPGFEESFSTSGPRRTADAPPWERLDEVDPTKKAADEAGSPVGRSFINGIEIPAGGPVELPQATASVW